MTRKNQKIIYPELSYKITGVLFKVHNELGRYCKEKQYQDVLEQKLRDRGLQFEREKTFPINREVGGNQVDFCIENKILLECKAKSFLTKDDFYQMLRYLKAAKMKLGFIVNFRNKYLKPKRILNPDINS
jgi:GxxExxY protein